MSIDNLYKNFDTRADLSLVDFNVPPLPIILPVGYGDGISLVVIKGGGLGYARTSVDSGFFEVRVFTDDTLQRIKELISKSG